MNPCRSNQQKQSIQINSYNVIMRRQQCLLFLSLSMMRMKSNEGGVQKFGMQQYRRYHLRDASRSLQWILCFNILFISAIERKMTVFNGKSLRYLYFSVLLAVNMRFSRNLAFSSYGELFSVYINNLCSQQIVQIYYLCKSVKF